MNVSLLEIFCIFFKIGIQLIGGGYVIIPLLKKYLVDEKKWISEEELIDYFAMSQCIPGIIACNLSVFVAYKARKTLGAIAAIVGFTLPSLICILLLANLLNNIVSNKIIENAFWGIRISVIVLVIMTIKEMWKTSINSLFSYILFAFIVCFLIFLPVSPFIVIICAALIGISYSGMRGKNNA